MNNQWFGRLRKTDHPVHKNGYVMVLEGFDHVEIAAEGMSILTTKANARLIHKRLGQALNIKTEGGNHA